MPPVPEQPPLSTALILEGQGDELAIRRVDNTRGINRVHRVRRLGNGILNGLNDFLHLLVPSILNILSGLLGLDGPLMLGCRPLPSTLLIRGAPLIGHVSL